MKKILQLRNPFSNLSFLHVINDGYLASMPLLLPFVQGELGIGFREIGLLGSILGASGTALALPSSWLAKRYGGMRILFVAVFLYSLSFLIVGFSSGFYTLAAAFFLASIGFGVFHPIGFALVAGTSDAKAIGKKMGNFTAVGDFGRIGIAAAVTFFVSIISWRGTAFAYGLTPLVCITFSFFLFRQQGGKPEQPGRQEKNKAQSLLRNGTFIMMALAGALDSLASSSLFIFLPFLLLHRGIPTALIGTLSGAFFAGNLLGKVIIGRFVDRFGGFRVFTISELSMAALLVMLALSPSVPAIIVLSVCLGALAKGTVPVVTSLVASSVGPEGSLEQAFGVSSFIGSFAGILAPLAFGFLAAKYGIISVFLFSACIALSAILPVISIALYSRLKKQP